MFAYRHQFHAGNFADVFKHALLAQLLTALKKKEKSFLYLDTHAGIGTYDLQHEWSQKNAEHLAGISLVWQRTDAPAEMQAYLDIVRAQNPNGLRHYPGSPLIAQKLLRAHDRMVLTEINRNDCDALQTMFAGDRRVLVELTDGYQALKARLPPLERRGLILIDSSFDRSEEFARLTAALAAAHRKFATGVYALWYPLMAAEAMRNFESDMIATGIRKILLLEISVKSAGSSPGLRGSGLLIVNPPFGFEPAARAIIEWLAPVLAAGAGDNVASLPPASALSRIEWLVPE